jgi:TatD DNase family protein
MLELIDSHCHIDRVDLSPFDHSVENMLEASRKLDVSTMICVCIDLESFPTVHSLATNYPSVYCSVGVHPTEEEVEEPSLQSLLERGALDKVVAIGETGLDYFRLSEEKADVQKNIQKARFLTHIQAAKMLKKPLIIHTRLAQTDTIALLKTEPSCHGVFHCFTEDWSMAKAGLDLGYFISFSGIVTFKNATDLQEVAKKIPIDRLLIETDAPYLTPVPYRGKSNYPGNVHYVAKFLAELRGESYESIAQHSTQNAKKLFGLTSAK